MPGQTIFFVRHALDEHWDQFSAIHGKRDANRWGKRLRELNELYGHWTLRVEHTLDGLEAAEPLDA